MTVFGIAGCCALLVTGFGLRDSIHSIVERQFGELYKYNLSLYLSEDSVTEKDAILQDILLDKSAVNDFALIHSQTGSVDFENESGTLNIVVPKNVSQLKENIVLRNRKTGKDIPFDENSFIVTEKLCETLGISVGDKVALRNYDGKTSTITVSGIAENYITAYAFLSPALYEKSFGSPIEYDRAFVSVVDDSDDARAKISERILESDNVLMLQFTQTIRESFENTVKSIDYIVLVLIVAAGALAMIVLYNLTNINICERRKELATIKVLGFRRNEVASYIYRETTILCLIGTTFGFAVGAWLHNFVVRTAEVDSIMFGRTASFTSYLYATIITLIFTAIVDLIMLKKLNSINMVESMKANE
ncbi:MAG: ABC transporter permease [Clostridia bacterium]